MRRPFTLASAFVAALTVAWSATPVSAAGSTHAVAPAAASSNVASRDARTDAATQPDIPSTPTQLAAFPGGGEQAAITAAGSGNPAVTTPADPSIAAGASDVVEAVNSAVFVYSRTGTFITSFNVDNLIQTPAGWSVRDPRVAFDPSSGLFILMALEFNGSPTGCGSQVVVIVSQSNPALTWSLRGSLSLASQLSGVELANVSMALTGTLIVESSDYQMCGAGGPGAFVASQTDIMQKADIMTGHSTVSSVVAKVPGPLGVQPVMGLGLTTVAYQIANDANCSGTTPVTGMFAVFTITGTPDAHNAQITCSLQVTQSTATSVPPAALQNGTATTLATDDDRFLDAAWVGNKIWATGNTGCTPGGDTHVRSCVNVVNVGATTTGTVSPGAQLAPEGVNGAYLYYPSIALDSAGDVFTAFDESSSTTPESMQVATITGSTWSTFIPLHASTNPYSPAGCSSCNWGDYSGAVQDPLHPTDVWVVSSDDDSTTTSTNCPSLSSCWDTYVGRYTFAAPSVSSLTPASGTGGGGQVVTVAGSDFASDTTAVIGSTPITIGNLTPDSFTFTTPAGPPAGGVVHVVATDSIGSSSATSAGSGYLYVPLADYTPVVPFRILDTRSGSVHALGPNATMILQVDGAGPAGATPVPTTAVAVVLNVTAVNGTAGSLLTVFPTGTPQPKASNLNFAAGTVTANLVTVTLGTNGVTKGAVSIYNSLGTVNVLADVEGYFAPPVVSPSPGEFHPIPPVRVCDTRSKSPTPACKAHGVLVGGTSMVVNVTGGTVPSDGTAEAVVLNITGVIGTAPAYLSVFPTTSTGSCSVPKISTLNLIAGTVVANRVMVQLGPATTGGHTTSVCVFASAGKINVLLDASGWYGSASAVAGYQYQAIAPSRICDTRIASVGCTTGSITAGFGASRLVHVAGEGGVPSTGPVVQAVIANLTGIVPSNITYMVAFPSNLTSTPGASDINLSARETLPNLVVVQLDTTAGPDLGCINIFNAVGTVNAVLDIEGWFQ